MRYRARALVVCALAVGLAAAGCSKNSGNTGSNTGPTAAPQAIDIDTAGTAPTPAPAIPGAKSGGTVTWLEDGAPEHLDPLRGFRWRRVEPIPSVTPPRDSRQGGVAVSADKCWATDALNFSTSWARVCFDFSAFCASEIFAAFEIPAKDVSISV